LCNVLDNEERCGSMPTSSLVKEMTDNKLDGFLINIECAVPDVAKLIEFIVKLRKEMKDVNSDSELIWYDSVLHTTGELKWQSQLND